MPSTRALRARTLANRVEKAAKPASVAKPAAAAGKMLLYTAGQLEDAEVTLALQARARDAATTAPDLEGAEFIAAILPEFVGKKIVTPLAQWNTYPTTYLRVGTADGCEIVLRYPGWEEGAVDFAKVSKFMESSVQQ